MSALCQLALRGEKPWELSVVHLGLAHLNAKINVDIILCFVNDQKTKSCLRDIAVGHNKGMVIS